MGFGVTAVDRVDAEEIIRATFFTDRPLPTEVDLQVDVDVGTLDAGHVLSNMGDPSVRGVWFPRF